MAARAVVTLPLDSASLSFLPLRVRSLQRLRDRGVTVECVDRESPDENAARIETELMLAFQSSGTGDDFEALYEHARGPLLVWITSLASGRRAGLEATELLQDTFVNVYRYAKSFRDHGPRSFRVWSRTIAGNLVRRTRFERRRSWQDMPEGLQEPTDRREGPPAELLGAEDLRLLRHAWLLLLTRYAAAYEQLSERDRVALHLIEVEEYTYQEACRRLNVGLSNLKMILFRARRRIRAAISADFGLPAPRETAERPARLKRAG